MSAAAQVEQVSAFGRQGGDEFRGRRPHAMVVPFPAQGHVGPMMHLSVKLAAEAGFAITFVATHHIYASLEQMLEPRLREHGLTDNVRLVRLVNDGCESGDTTGRGGLVELCKAVFQLGPSLEKIVVESLEQYPPITCIISDLYLHFTQDIARKHGLHHVAFWTASATMLAMTMAVVAHGCRAPAPDVHSENDKDDDDDDPTTMITWVPGAPPLLRSELNSFLLYPDPDDLMYSIYAISYMRIRDSTCVAVNTFDELEPDALAALHAHNSPVEIHSVGPVLPYSYFDDDRDIGTTTTTTTTIMDHITTTTTTTTDTSNNGGGGGDDETPNGRGPITARLASYPMASLWKEDNKSLRWLDRQAPESVLYVSFGSIAIMSKEQFAELATGLELSGIPILWVVRPDLKACAGGEAAFPDGFLIRTKEKILVVEWAPQLQVLAHAAVGGFLSHCGWNSTLESLSAGVPTLGWPYFSDQMLDNRLLVDAWGLGLEFDRRGASDDSLHVVSHDEVSRKVCDLMATSGPRSKLKEAASRWRDSARRAVLGSSTVALRRLLESLLP